MLPVLEVFAISNAVQGASFNTCKLAPAMGKICQVSSSQRVLSSTRFRTPPVPLLTMANHDQGTTAASYASSHENGQVQGSLGGNRVSGYRMGYQQTAQVRGPIL